MWEPKQDMGNLYKSNTTKEDVLLWYVENFKQQFHHKYPKRKPLLLAARNYYGINKMVCTFIRPTSLPYQDLYNWKGCSRFVADYLNYQPLNSPTDLPAVLKSPTEVLEKREGNCFEYSTVLCSFLIGAGFNAYVVSGYSSREVCYNDLTRVYLPFYTEGTKEASSQVSREPSKYEVSSGGDFQSRFEIEMRKKKMWKLEEQNKAREELKMKKMQELEKPPQDPFFGSRIHSWILVLPGSHDVFDAFFIEPATGEQLELHCSDYLGIESIWNDKNYWVNIQGKKSNCEFQFNLSDLKCWEHFLVGEQSTSSISSSEKEKNTVALSKHLDMPSSWANQLFIPYSAYESRYPGNMKVVLYKKLKVEKFAPYLRKDGLIKCFTRYKDYEWTEPDFIYKWFVHRADNMIKTQQDLENEIDIENFSAGRKDAVQEHWHQLCNISPVGKHCLHFYCESRNDSLHALHVEPLQLTEEFQSRDDLMYFRWTVFKYSGNATSNGAQDRVISKVVEKFHRNLEKQANEDIAEREFDLEKGKISLKYHYEEGSVTFSTKEFPKPHVGRLRNQATFDAQLITGYQADPTADDEKPLVLFHQLQKLLDEEKKTLSAIQRMEKEFSDILRYRNQEKKDPKLNISAFDPLRNYEARVEMKKKDEELQERTARELGVDVNIL